ncbi:hypothetical protein LK540_09675 [Massilia sp. IC2-278]|uniref:hypothetical protein n=1 Tax=Massilia sp. IC2-278 TaxID=2887200 RepID=UPI001E2A6AC7|nr:hypothetical protein [Massilia sp. IC2-278]MCC2960692.1 hypothetical protein [Massilia sp. IC2-278]
MQTLPPPVDPALAFPAALRPCAVRVAAGLAAGDPHPPRYNFAVSLGGETLAIPTRVYYAPERVAQAIAAPGMDGLIALCLGTRHHDGFLRERCLRRLLDERRDWIVPFVVQLVGEYVAEIVQLIEDALPRLDAAAYGRFLLENPRFLATTERRVVSYGYAYPDYRENAGRRVIAAFKRMRDASDSV